MANKESAIELDQSLSLLEQSFFQELRKIAEQRLKLERVLPGKVNLSTNRDFTRDIREVKPSVPQTFTVRLDSSLGVKLAKSRGTADELEDKLQDTRIAFEDKLQIVDRMRKELDRRENVLVQSIQEIEAYLRAIFYLKQEADAMYVQLKDTSKEYEETLQEVKNCYDVYTRKMESIKNVITAVQPAKLFLENVVSVFPRYSSIQNLVEYYLVLETLQKDLLGYEMEISRMEGSLAAERLQLAEFKKRIPMISVAKESEFLERESKLKIIRGKIANLEEQIDMTIFSRVRDDATWYDIQRWIKKMFLASSEIRPPGPEEPTAGTLNMLDRIKDFVACGFEIVDRLKGKK